MIYLFWAYSYGLTSDRLRLYFEDFALIPVAIPPIDDQRRVAEILGTWDRAIETTETLIAASNDQKKSLLQKLITGQKRLPGFEEKWHEIRLIDIAEVIVSNVDKKTVDGEIPVRLCNYMDVHSRDQIQANQEFMPSTATSAQVKRFALKLGDVLITKDSETPDDIAVASVVSTTAPDLLCGYHLAIVRPRKGIDGAFLKHLFAEPKTRYYFSTRANGATRFGLPLDAIERAPLRCPPHDEQRAIARVLASAEAEIRILNQKLKTLKTERSALMQQLLTGKRRVRATEIAA
jgi:type I restriction enzyme S subunit